MRRLRSSFLVPALLVLAVASALDLHLAQQKTLVLYTTPALRDLLEQHVIPAFRNATGAAVVPLYVTAGEEFYRVKLSGNRPEADLFVHASPLFLEKGFAEGLIESVRVEGPRLNATAMSAPTAGGHHWYAFAWSPLVEVFAPDLGSAPDLASTNATLGLPHPLLSNNGVYNTILLDDAGAEVARTALERTRVQPTNARATISGVADGSYDVTLGYEAVAAFFVDRGADVEYELPRIHGERATTPVLFSAGLVRNHPHESAAEFLRFLLQDEVQDALGRYYFRSVRDNATAFEGALSVEGVRMVRYDWSEWRALEDRLPEYEVKG